MFHSRRHRQYFRDDASSSAAPGVLNDRDIVVESLFSDMNLRTVENLKNERQLRQKHGWLGSGEGHICQPHDAAERPLQPQYNDTGESLIHHYSASFLTHTNSA